MKQEPSFFDAVDPALVYIAKKLREAVRLEELFNENGIDYGVEADHYRGGVIFRTVRAGAFFYVRPDSADAAREVMRRHGYRPFEGENPAVE
jgi:hypothetical protein